MQHIRIPLVIAGMGLVAGGVFAWQSIRFHIALDDMLHMKLKTTYNVQVADMVHYVLPNGRCVPAMILDVIGDGGLVDVSVFDSQASHHLEKDRQYVMSVIRNVSPNERKQAGTWHYQELDRIANGKAG